MWSRYTFLSLTLLAMACAACAPSQAPSFQDLLPVEAGHRVRELALTLNAAWKDCASHGRLGRDSEAELAACRDDACREAALVGVLRGCGYDLVAVLTDASPCHDFVLLVKGSSGEIMEGSVEGPGSVTVFSSATGDVIQHIEMDNLYAEMEDDLPVVNRAQLYGRWNAVLVMDDYNFDGFEDLALRNGNFGSYRGPSYDIFIFDPQKGTYVPSPALSELASENLGLFGVDKERQQLVTFNKSGCCWHILSFYAVSGMEPVLVREIIEDAISRPGFLETTERVLENGVWSVRTHMEVLEEND